MDDCTKFLAAVVSRVPFGQLLSAVCICGKLRWTDVGSCELLSTGINATDLCLISNYTPTHLNTYTTTHLHTYM